MQPTIGRIVHYTLSEGDADAINRRRTDYAAFQRTLPVPVEPGNRGATGHVAHVGNRVLAGDVCGAFIVRVFYESTTTVNLQVLLDGADTYWATSRTEGEGEGHWAWPPRG